MKKEAFNKENPIELLSQLLKVLRRDGLEDSVDLLKRHKLLKIITEEYLEVKRRVASGKPSFPKMRKGDHLGGMKAASSNMRPEEIVKHLFSDRTYGEYIEEMTENALADKRTQAKLLIDYLKKNKSAREEWSRWFSGEDMNKRASEKKASPKLFEQLEFASGAEKKRLLTEMSDYGVNIMRGKFAEMGLSRQEQEAVLFSALKEAQAARLKADKDSLKKFGRMRMVKHPVMDANGDKIRLSKKLRFGIFFQFVGKGFIQ